MSATGYVKNGVYHNTEKVPIDKLVIPQQSMFKQGDHARQRFDHSAEILQPYVGDKPNPKFIEAHPDAAEEYGFTPRTSPAPNVAPAHGSIPWGQVAP